MFKTPQDRAKFFKSLGTFYAGLGGTFGAYSRPAEAFLAAKDVAIYRHVGFKLADFEPFRNGFNNFQELRIALQQEKARAQAEMSALLETVNLFGIKVSNAKHYTELTGEDCKGS